MGLDPPKPTVVVQVISWSNSVNYLTTYLRVHVLLVQSIGKVPDDISPLLLASQNLGRKHPPKEISSEI